MIVLALVALLVAAGAFWAKGRGYKTHLLSLVFPVERRIIHHPSVLSIYPSSGQTAVLTTTDIRITLILPNGPLDPATFSPSTLALAREDGTPVAAAVSLTPTGALIVIKPMAPLEPATRYTLELRDIQDQTGVSIRPYKLHFTTARPIDPDLRFEKLPISHASDAGFTCIEMGPDGKLWAGADDGRIFRFDIAGDATLSEPQIITSLQTAEGGPRLLTGFCFDAASTPQHPIVWVTHGHYAFTDVPDWTGKLSRMSGPNLEHVEDIVIHLPRSVRDHLTNQPVVGPDGAIYFNQGSNTACGASDDMWGHRDERLLSASILRLDPARLAPGLPIDAKTRDGGGMYDPYASDAPLTMYATGVRVAYDLLWASNGRLYAPINGASAGGNTPGGAQIAALNRITGSQHDYLAIIEPGRYYGHPNPLQGHYVLGGGNPTAAVDPVEVRDYPVGTAPDPKWAPPIFDFGRHVSPNGITEYRAGAFAGKMKGMLLVCRYNAGSDIIAIELDDDGTVAAAHAGIPGMAGLRAPLDVAADPNTGAIYVAEYGARRITLLRPISD